MADWAAQRGHTLTVTPWFEPEPPLPPAAELDLLVVLGGPMSVHDQATFPWLRTEKAYLRTALAAGTPTLGLCLGSQLLAEALGAKVGRNAEPEVGFWPVQFTPAAQQLPLLRHAPAEWTALHWHFDAFTLPPGAVALASSAATACQGFAYEGRVVGLQFHPEANDELLDVLVAAEGATLPAGRYVQPLAALQARRPALAHGAKLLFPLLDALLAVPTRDLPRAAALGS